MSLEMTQCRITSHLCLVLVVSIFSSILYVPRYIYLFVSVGVVTRRAAVTEMKPLRSCNNRQVSVKYIKIKRRSDEYNFSSQFYELAIVALINPLLYSYICQTVGTTRNVLNHNYEFKFSSSSSQAALPVYHLSLLQFSQLQLTTTSICE